MRDIQVLRSKKCKHWTGIIGWEIHHNIKAVSIRELLGAYWGLGCVRWWWVYFKYGSVQQIMSLIFVRIWHTHENSDSFDTLKQDKIRLDTFGIGFQFHSLDLQGEPYTEMLFDVVLVSHPIHWVAIEIGLFHSYHADSYGSQLSALGPPRLAFGRNGPLALFAFYAGRSVLFPQMPRAFHNGSVSWLHLSAWRLLTLVIQVWSNRISDLACCRWIYSNPNNPMSPEGDLLEVLLIT